MYLLTFDQGTPSLPQLPTVFIRHTTITERSPKFRAARSSLIRCWNLMTMGDFSVRFHHFMQVYPYRIAVFISFYLSNATEQLAGMFAITIMPIFYSSTVTLGPPEKPPSGELVSQTMSMIRIRGVWSPPSVIEQLVALPGGLDAIGSLDWMFFTGGPLAQSVGDVVSRHTDLCQLYGSTETGPQIALIPRPENWSWFEWHPVLQNAMEDMGEGMYEMVCYKEPKWDHLLHLQQAYPELDVWRTRDLFVRHPENSKLWRFVGRRDDVIVLSNGEKFNPVDMEGAITGHPLVKGAIIIGTARIQASLVVEPANGVDMSKKEFIEQIWPTILEANQLGPAHGRIFRHKVTVAKPEKPFIRAGKGTIIRAQTARLYTDEVEQLYKEDASDDVIIPKLHSTNSLDTVTTFVRDSITSVLAPMEMSDSDDLFVLGMDSLQTLELSKTLQKGLKPYLREGSNLKLGAPQIYGHPTVTGLSKYILRALGHSEHDRASEGVQTRIASMASLVAKHISAFPRRSSRKLCVAVSGTTGSLGSYILEALLRDNNIHKIYCLNRSSDAPNRQQQIFKARGKVLDLGFKVQFLTVQFGQNRFGLDEADYEQLRENVDAVLHNAWKVDFNHQLSSFEDVHIQGVRDLAAFSLSSNRHPHIFFVSSISSVGNWGKVRGYDEPVPEASLDTYTYDVALPLGYAESKHVSERILTSAVANEGLQASILRVGQVAGPVAPDAGGVWNLSEWMPALVKTSKALGLLPETMNTIDWIPVDTLADIVTELIQTGCTGTGSQTYNIINPHGASWPDMLDAIQEHWKSAGMPEARIVPWEEWLSALKGASENCVDISALPAVKLVDFFTGLAEDAEACKSNRLTYQTRKSRAASRTMAELQAIDRAAMETWMKQWNF